METFSLTQNSQEVTRLQGRSCIQAKAFLRSTLIFICFVSVLLSSDRMLHSVGVSGERRVLHQIILETTIKTK